ncbi:uncharacterized protein SPSK_05029 [Sporothrix schenckii 1099-18]|uniref:Uncharacterized protein n=1 Tax=Sporothrix schenckii 1099-18 TaxID=1397361 RepID=A0A0F2LT88_SPOSC|nr:uncharacterized protein SPSK_05029 [Sporothrix schenckii 1099-18]KJR80697.1 hypothetical protein SPSK_05029 [Sporothrix schenckii 1099-18]
MTRLGPLTSQALGRSPYDILVLGNGEANPREPPQDYDERGRPVNAETKRINRNIVRSHNEVMHVIGVAEPDSLITAESESDNQLIQQHLEDMLGRKLWDPARVIGALGVWGAEPLRQRALLYTQFSTYPPWRHFRQDYGLHPLFDILSSGVLASVVDRFLRHASLERKSIRENLWSLFSCLQRLAIIPAFPWLPGPLYFVPFSSDSPIARPPILPTSYSFGGVAEWVGQVLFCVAPIAVFYGYTELREQLSHHLNYAIYDTLNTPSNPPLQRPVSEFNPYTGERRLAGLPNVEVLPPRPPVPPPPPPQQQTQTRTRPAVPPPPADSQRLLSEGDEHNDSNRRNAIDGVQDAVAVDESANERAGEASGSSETTPTQQQHRTSTTPPPGSPTNAPRRRNTVSSGGGGDGYISEEEEFELSATLVSFDVEAGSAGDAPPNAWSAELRQSATVSIGYEGDGYGPFGGSPSLGTYLRGVYYPGVNAPFNSDTMLSRLPAAILSDNAASLAAKLLLVDCEAAVVRLMARGYRLQHGQRVDDLYDLGTVPFPFVPGGTFSLSAANHYAMAIVLEAAVKSVGVLAALGISWLYRGSQQGWSFMRVVREKLKLYGAQKRESDPIDVV